MVTPMPGIKAKVSIEGNQPDFGMAKGSVPVIRLQRAQESHPAPMQRLQQRQ